MAIQTFTALQVLTAAQQNALQANDYNQTVSTKVASYTLVAADKGTKLVMNAGASNTAFTVNTSLFSAGDTLTILNISTSGVCTITAGTATVSSAGSLALGLNQGGTLYFTSAGVAIFLANGVPAGLTLISATTIGTTVSSVTVTNAFSATYDAYKIVVTGGSASANHTMSVQLGASVTGYNQGQAAINYTTGVVTGRANASTTSFTRSGTGNTSGLELIMDLVNPFLAKFTYMSTGLAYNDEAGQTNGFHGVATSYTDFTISPSTGTYTGGTIRVYGYANS